MAHEPGHIDAEVQDVPQEAVAPALTAPEGFMPEGTDSANVERLSRLREADEADQDRSQRSFGRRAYEGIVEPTLRALNNAAGETSDAVVGLGGFIVNAAIGDDPVSAKQQANRDQFLDWYQQRDRFNPLKGGDEFNDDFLGGPSNTFAEGIIEGGIQFAAGFIGAGKLLAVTKLTKLGRPIKALLGASEGSAFKVLLKGIGAGTGKIKAIKEALAFSFRQLAFDTTRGAVADFAVFDGHEARLADLLQSHTNIRNDVQQFLRSDKDDTDFEGRTKNLLEGGMIGVTADIFLGGVRGLRAWRRAVKAAGEGDTVLLKSATEEMVEKIVESEQKRLTTIESREIPEGERVAVLDNKDGTATLLVRGDAETKGGPVKIEGKELPDAGEPTKAGQTEMTFRSRNEAEEVGAALELVERARLMQRGQGATGFDPLTASSFQREAIRIEDAFRTGDKDAIFVALGESSVNLKYIYNSVRAKSALASLAQQFPEVGKRVQFSFEEIKRIGGDLFPSDANEDQVRAAMAEIFGETDNLAGNVIWMRAWMASLGNEAQKLARLVETASTPAARDIHMSELTRSLDNMLDTSDLLTGTLSNVGRGLRAAAIPIAPRKIKGKNALAELVANAENLSARADEAATKGTRNVKVDKELEEVLDLLEKTMRETTDEGIAGVRQTDVPTPETLPRGEAPEGAAAAQKTETTPLVLSTADRKVKLVQRANELIESEAGREGKLRELEGLESPTAPPVRRSVRDMSPEDIDALTRAVFLADNGEPADILRSLLIPATRTVAEDGARFVNRPELRGWRKAFATVQWLQVNNMLSGVPTHVVNNVTNAGVSVLRVAEMATGGALNGNRESLKASADLLVGYGMNLGDHWRASVKAMKGSRGVLDPKMTHFSGSFRNTQDALHGGTGSQMVKIVGIPGSALMGADEFAVQANYRSHLRMGALREGRKLGKEGEELSKFVDAQLRMGYGADGQAINVESRQFARVNTFKDELGPSGQAFEDFVNSETPIGAVLQFLMPFRKTPMKITKFGLDRNPAFMLASNKWRRAVSGADGAAAKEEALGRFVIGSTMYSTAAWLFMNDQLTGSGPRDPKAKAAWDGAGKKPGTLTVGGLSIKLDRADPIMTPLILTANLMEAASELDDETYAEAAAVLALTMAETISDRAFFNGMSEFLEAATGGNPDKMARVLANRVSGFVPNVAKTGNTDDLFREADGFVEEVLRNTMGFSDDLEVRRNLFGEPALKPVGYGQRALNPFTMTWGSTVGEELGRQLYDIGADMRLPDEVLSFGEEGGSINLRQRGKYLSTREGASKKQSPYDRWQELAASKKVNGGRTLKDRLIRLSETDQWKNGDPTVKKNLVERIVSASQQVAKRLMLSEFPALQDEVIFRKTISSVKNSVADEATIQSVRDQFGLTEQGRFERLRDRLNK